MIVFYNKETGRVILPVSTCDLDEIVIEDNKAYRNGVIQCNNMEISAYTEIPDGQNLREKIVVDGEEIERYKLLSDLVQYTEDERWSRLLVEVDQELRETEWYKLPDAGLDEDKQVEATAYRSALFNLRVNNPDIDDAVSAFKALKASKPSWSLW